MKVAVIGAGIAGLSCAWELRKAGMDVEVFEKHATVGGRMNTRTKNGLAFDVGANFLIGAYTSVNALALEMGVALRNASPVAHIVYRNGHPYSMNLNSIRSIFRMGALDVRSRVRLLAFVLKVRSEHAGLDFFDLGLAPDALNHEDAYAYARREVGQEFADYIVDSFNSCMMFSRSSETSAAAFLSLFGMMADPANDFSVHYADGDMRAMPQALANRLGVHCDRQVVVLERHGAGWRVVTTDSTSVFERVVLAVTPCAALGFLKSGAEPQRLLLAQSRYASTINVSFRVPKETLGHTHCFYVPYVENQIISEFTNESLKGDDTRDGQGQGGLFLCGDYMNAPWIEGARRSGQKVARQLIRGRTSAI